MKNRPSALIVLAAGVALLALPLHGAEKTVADLEKELALAKAENAYLKAQAEFTRTKAALEALQTGKPAPDPETPPAAGDTGKPAATPKPKTPERNPVLATTEKLRDKLPDSFEWRQVEKFGTDLLIHAGTRVIAPYTLDKTTHELKTDGTRLGGYIELLYSNTWAWQPDGAASSIAYGVDAKLPGGSQWNKSWQNGVLLSDSDATLVNPLTCWEDFDDRVDYTTRLSFEFGNGAARSAGTITGSGDFSGEVAFDAHFLQGYATNTLFTLGLGGSVGASTDREARRVHPRYFGGVVGKLSRVVTKSGDKKRLALAHLGLGYAEVDNLRFDPTDATRTHVLFEGAVPSYRRSGGAALEFELFYPIADANYAYVGARLYDRTDPGQWSVTIGYSFDPVDFLKGFASSSNAAEPGAKKTGAPEK